MVLEFLSEADASSAFKINNASDLLNKIKEHPLFDKFEIHRYARPSLPPRWTTYRDSDSFNIFIFYYSGLEKQYVMRRVEIRRYKNILRLIPEEPKYEWITTDITIVYPVAMVKNSMNLIGIKRLSQLKLLNFVAFIQKMHYLESIFV